MIVSVWNLQQEEDCAGLVAVHEAKVHAQDAVRFLRSELKHQQQNAKHAEREPLK